MARKKFSDQMKMAVAKIQKSVDQQLVNLTRYYFTLIIQNTPTKGETVYSQGVAVNNWNVSINSANFATTDTPSPTRTMPLRRVNATVKKGTFLKDTTVSLCNGLDYIWHVEYLGWPENTPGHNWKGAQPYRMVAISTAAVKAKLK